MTTKEHAVVIRTALKAKGWTSRDVSVRIDLYSLGSSIDVTIKNPDIPFDVVAGIASAAERIRRDERSGEILSGGNRYVSVSYSREAREVHSQKWLGAVSGAVAALAVAGDNSLLPVNDTPYLVGNGSNGYGFTIWSSGEFGSYRTSANDVRGVAEWIGAAMAGAWLKSALAGGVA